MNALIQKYDVPGDDFSYAGEASGQVKRTLKKLGYDPDTIRRVSIAMYEGEINMVIHAKGGKALVEIYSDCIKVLLEDEGPGIKDIAMAMQEGYSTAPEYVRSLGFGAGMGLPNIKKFTDELNIDSELGKGTKVYFTVKVKEK